MMIPNHLPLTNERVAFVSKRESYYIFPQVCAGLILGLRLASERRRYFVTTSLIGWVQP